MAEDAELSARGRRPRREATDAYKAQFTARAKLQGPRKPSVARHACRCLRCERYFLAVRETKFCSRTCRTVYDDRARASRERRDDEIRKAMDERFEDPYWMAARGEVPDATESSDEIGSGRREDDDDDDLPSFLRLRLTQG